MQLSTKFCFAFLCMPKCASTSIEAAIEPYCNINIGGHPAAKHMNIRLYKRYIGEFHAKILPNKHIETFCLMREPIEWLESWYRYRSRDEINDSSHPNYMNYTGNILFSDFIEEYLSEDPRSFARVGNQYEFMRYKEDVGVDKVFKMEELDKVSAYLRNKLNNNISIPKYNTSPKFPLKIDDGLRKKLEVKLEKDYLVYNSL